MINIRATSREIKELIKDLHDVELKIKNMSPLLDEIIDDFDFHRRTTWATENNGTWPQYEESFASYSSGAKYRHWKSKKKPGTEYKLLELNGLLKDSFVSRKINQFSFEYGTEVEYASIHHYGEPPVARRPFWDDGKLMEIGMNVMLDHAHNIGDYVEFKRRRFD